MEINKRTELNIFKIGYYWYEGEHEKDLLEYAEKE